MAPRPLRDPEIIAVTKSRKATLGHLPDAISVDSSFAYYTHRVFRVADSALKHGYSIEEISHAYDMAIFHGLIESEDEPTKILSIGPDSAGNLLELVGGSRPNGDYVIWHAMRCRPRYLAMLPGGGR